jgi:hypothetical protein
MAPANWDGPFLISPHDPNTLYAGTNILWRSRDQGRNWEDLGDHTTGVDRRTLPIMGELPVPETLSLDDGIPYYPTLTAVAESPLEEGVLYVGSDDGNVKASTDGGRNWTEVSDRMSGLPTDTWVNGIETSRFVPGRVYVATNNYRNDDFTNYLFASDDYGQSWQDITGDLPADRVVRVVREDPRNPEVLYLATEFGAFYSLDRGSHWMELSLGMPTVAVNDLVIHPRDNDLILGTHGRGIWIFDNLNAFQEATPETLQSSAHLFSMEPAEQIRYRSEKGHNGDMIFRGENPAPGALMDFWLDDAGKEVTLTVLNQGGNEVATVPSANRKGMNRAVWNLRHTDPDQRPGQPPRGPLVVPGEYRVRLEADGTVSEGLLEVREDPRIDVAPEIRRQWTEDLLALGDLARDVAEGAQEIVEVKRRVDDEATFAETLGDWAAELERQWNELRNRSRGLVREVEGWVGPMTGDQLSQKAYYQEMVDTLRRETRTLAQQVGGPSPVNTPSEDAPNSVDPDHGNTTGGVRP